MFQTRLISAYGQIAHNQSNSQFHQPQRDSASDRIPTVNLFVNSVANGGSVPNNTIYENISDIRTK